MQSGKIIITLAVWFFISMLFGFTVGQMVQHGGGDAIIIGLILTISGATINIHYLRKNNYRMLGVGSIVAVATRALALSLIGMVIVFWEGESLVKLFPGLIFFLVLIAIPCFASSSLVYSLTNRNSYTPD